MRIAAWNIETLGSLPKNLKPDDELSYHNLRGRLIAEIIRTFEIDVLVIQEVREPRGLHSINHALVHLNKKSQYYADIIGAGITEYKDRDGYSNYRWAAHGPAVSNHESYSVIFKSGTLIGRPISLADAKTEGGSCGINDYHYIRLSNKGAKVTFSGDEKFQSNFVFSERMKSIYPIARKKPPMDSELTPEQIKKIPKASAAEGITTRSALNRKSTEYLNEMGTIFQRKNVLVENTRRPCVVELALSPTVTVPFVVYHAPVNDEMLIFGSETAIVSKELLGQSAILAGDFNARTNSQEYLYSWAYQVYAYMFGYDSWEACSDFLQRKGSMVHYCEECEGNVKNVSKAVSARVSDDVDEKSIEDASPEDYQKRSLRDYTFEINRRNEFNVKSNDVAEFNERQMNNLCTELQNFLGENYEENIKILGGIFYAIIRDCNNCHTLFLGYQSFFEMDDGKFLKPQGKQMKEVSDFLFRNLLSDHLPVLIEVEARTR